MIIPGEVIVTVDSVQTIAIVALAVAFARSQERVARLEALDEANQRAHRDDDGEW